MPEPHARPTNTSEPAHAMNGEGRRLLGFDFGLRRIGTAIGQTITETATPLETIESRDGHPDWEAIDALVETWRPDLLVLGMPSNADGSAHALARPIARFRRSLEARYGLKVELVDENLSSTEASELLRHQRQKGRKRRVRKAELDRVSAAILLERWITAGG